jgi:hypothetical protein
MQKNKESSEIKEAIEPKAKEDSLNPIAEKKLALVSKVIVESLLFYKNTAPNNHREDQSVKRSSRDRDRMKTRYINISSSG